MSTAMVRMCAAACRRAAPDRPAAAGPRPWWATMIAGLPLSMQMSLTSPARRREDLMSSPELGSSRTRMGRPGKQRPRDGDALALAAAAGCHRLARLTSGMSDVTDSASSSLYERAWSAADAQVLTGRQVVEQRTALEDEAAQVAGLARQVDDAAIAGDLPADPPAAVAALEQTAQQVDDARLAAAARADQAGRRRRAVPRTTRPRPASRRPAS